MNTPEFATEKIRFLDAALPALLAASAVTGLVLVVVHWNLVPPEVLLAWLTVLGAVLTGCAALVWSFRRVPDAASAHRWLRRFRLAVLAGGLNWGLGGLILCQSGDPVYQSFVGFALAGIGAAAITALSIDRRTALLFVVPMLAPAAIRFLLEPATLSLAMGIILLVLLIFLIVTATRIERSLGESIRLRLQADEQKRLIQINERRLRFALDGTGQGLWDWDMEIDQVFYSRHWKTMLGYAESEIGLSIEEWKNRVHPDDRPAVIATLKRYLDGESPLYEAEQRLRCRDGRYKWFLTRAQLIERTANGEPKRMIGVDIDIAGRKAAEEAVQHLAFYDALTGLPNRRLLLDRLHHALVASERSRRFGALVFIDLDRFKQLNDSLGHAVGDLMLQEVARRLCQSVREIDTVARLGGDEFVVMLEDLSGDASAAEIRAADLGAKLQAALGQPYQLGEHRHDSTPSMGIVLFDGHQANPDELLNRADMAMYRAKQSGRNTLRFFDPAMQASVDARLLLKRDLREDIGLGHFVLHYQPQVDGAGQIIGAEAFVRWANPRRMMVSAHDFIPLAEESGLILPLGDWVLESACAQLNAWSRDPEWAELTISINLSARQFRDTNIVERILTILDRTGADPRRLKLELGEGLLLQDPEKILARMEALKARGVRFSLDRFGAGYSSLADFIRLPLDQLKLDHSFVRDLLTDPKAAAIARSVIVLGDALGLEVIAAGVETESQKRFLQAHACQAFQGYLFSQPLTLDELSRFRPPPADVAESGNR
ncbi:putative bifunctional diguanylate cyclase/phosphodiesterase [Thiobaca trueperi]|uniref:PAS domain S-box-containing protein/diguanylate cyclase (GGDEF)-like protein n=1 Tax=Thiobaca trueperi TaxID=127458 RepID=A0A4R3MYF0_9GAMM|nr:GGDEF domain-containing phosphodiesterase [Thiobaca trueperi]TCT19309.1 PAS domain S-box-containing protein/diguanylate cyclase (GGDEF)-like protein [Thiobaca trueperi]